MAELTVIHYADGTEHTQLFSVYLEAGTLDEVSTLDPRMKQAGFTFDEISEPTPYVFDDTYRRWRKLRWKVVPSKHARHVGYDEKGKPVHKYLDTAAFVVVNQRPLEDWEVEYWQGVKTNATRRVIAVDPMEKAA